MRRVVLAAAALSLATALASCSTMDEVTVIHDCGEPVTVTITHLTDSAPPQAYVKLVPPGTPTVVGGIINLGGDHLLLIDAGPTIWELLLSGDQLRDLDGPITIPPEACPVG
ncbi:MAG: hypothetical protein ACR2OI_03545 [Acidimicrobiia bacterium]